MSAIKEWLDALTAAVTALKSVVNLGRPQLIKLLDALRSNLEQFKDAATQNNVAKMHDLLAECEVESEMLEKRLFKALDAKTSKKLRRTVRRARSVKGRMTARKRAPRNTTIKKALHTKTAHFASTIEADDTESRQTLLLEIDDAIGRLRGLQKSLESSLY